MHGLERTHEHALEACLDLALCQSRDINHIVSVSRLRCERDSGQRLSSRCCPAHIETVGQSDLMICTYH